MLLITRLCSGMATLVGFSSADYPALGLLAYPKHQLPEVFRASGYLHELVV